MSRDYERKGDNPVSEEAATKTETEQGAELENLVEAVRIHSEFDTINQSQFYALKYLHDCLEVRTYSDISLAVRNHGIALSSKSLGTLVNAGFLD